MENIEEIVQDIRKNSDDWVLFLGTGVSFDNMKAADEEFIEQLKQLKDKDEDIKEKVCQAIQENDRDAVREILYGNVWNFLRTEEDEQKKRRQEYADKLAARKDINIEEYSKKAICKLLGQFSGTILTTCQDETIEAILENARCSTFEDKIYTPYSLTTSSRWKKQLDNNECMLIKLYGTCTESSGLLFSGKDMDMYYPRKEDSLPVMKMLESLFGSKKLLFIGMDLAKKKPGVNRNPALAPGITSLLKKNVSKGTGDKTKLHRYVLVEETEEGSPKSQRKLREKLGIETIVYNPETMEAHIPDCTVGQEGIRDSAGGDRAEGVKAEQKATTKEGLSGKASKDEALAKDAVEQVFWEYYNRRPRHRISKREMHILESHILKVDGQGSQEKSAVYNRDEVIRIALAANRFAEFIDLWKVMLLDEGTDKTISNILNQRIDSKSRQLHRLIRFYGDGFPMGFLRLTASDETDLDMWKKAVIRLDNSGAYVVSCNRKEVYGRAAYADALVRKAGISAGSEEGCQKVDSYLYPAAGGMDIIDIVEDAGYPKKTFGSMFDRMVEILRDKCDGYAALHALLETEFHIILEKVRALETYEKEPELLYYLLRECQVQPRDPQGFIGRIEELRKQIDEKERDEKEALCKNLMLYQVQMIVESRCNGCEMENISKLYEKAKDKIAIYTKKHGDNLLDESIFILKVQLNLLAARIYGLSAAMDGKISAEMVKKMESFLEMADTSIKERTDRMGGRYSFFKAGIQCLYGDYQLMQCRLPRENGEDTQNTKMAAYQDAVEKYNDALRFYQKYKAHYKLQEADAWLRLANVKHLMDVQNNDKENKEYLECLNKAYRIYRDYNCLHGIADVLKILGRTQDSYREQFNRAAETIYRELGDEQAVRDVITDKVKSAAAGVSIFTSHG